MNWTTQATLVLKMSHADRTVAVTVIPVSGGEWIAGAVESTRSAQTLDDVFEDHGHCTIGTFDDMGAAIRAGDRFVREWCKRGSIAKCTCKEIPKKRGRK